MDTLQDRPLCATWSRESKRSAEPAEAQWGFKGVELCSQHVDELVSMSSSQQGRSTRTRTRNASKEQQPCFSKVKRWPCILFIYFFIFMIWQTESGGMKSLSRSHWVSDWMCSRARPMSAGAGDGWMRRARRRSLSKPPLHFCWEPRRSFCPEPEALVVVVVVVVALCFTRAKLWHTHTHSTRTHTIPFTNWTQN